MAPENNRYTHNRHTHARRVVGAALAATVMVGLVQAAWAGTVTRTTSYDYDPATGRLTREIVEPGDSRLCLVTETSYDNYGNKAGTLERNCNGATGQFPGSGGGVNTEAPAPSTTDVATIAPRSSTASYTYNADGSWVVVTTNAQGHVQTGTYGAGFGALLGSKGPNVLRDANGNEVFSQWAYDGLGRKVLEKLPDGTGTLWQYALCTTGCGTATYSITSTPVKGPIDLAARTTGGAMGAYTKVFYDSLNRQVRTATPGFDGGGTAGVVVRETAYDHLGRVSRESLPYFQGATPVWTTYGYDNAGRKLLVTAPDGSQTRMVYDGLTTTVTNALGQQTTKTRNVAGQMAVIRDAQSKTLTLAYDPLGNLAQSTDAAGNIVKMQYDLRGRKIAMQDPDMGPWTYGYDVLGNLRIQTDAKGQVTEIGYDRLDRVVSKTEPSLNTNWTYDNCPRGVGKLCQASAGNGYDS